MSKPITLSDLNKTKFYQLPKAFFHNAIYKNMKNDSKIAYALLRDLLDLSIQNKWINENNEVYVKLSRSKLMDYLNIKGTQKFAQVMKELEDKELIIYKKIGLNKCNEIYICMPEELDKIYDDNKLLEKDPSNPLKSTKFENQTSGNLKIKPTEVRKSNFKEFENQTHIKTNNIKTNNIKTNNNNKSTNKQIATKKKDKSVVVTKQEFNKLKATLHIMLDTNLIDKDIENIAIALKQQYNSIDTEVVENICNIIKNSNSEINNVVGYFLAAIKNKYTNINYKNDNINKSLKFNNFDAREYDYDKLEKQLLGW